MGSTERELGRRIADLRRKHFGARGKAVFAERLGLPLCDYERFERGSIPPGETLVRMCELTGEDLQWLLTGVAARGTVVISGTRSRHQNLLTRLAAALDSNPTLASPVEAFLDLLLEKGAARPASERALSMPDQGDLVPIFDPDDVPRTLGRQLEQASLVQAEALPALTAGANIVAESGSRLAEPKTEYAAGDWREVTTIQVLVNERRRDFLRSAELARAFPGLFGVRLGDDSMTPMFAAGDVALVALGSAPQNGRPALYRLTDDRTVSCRIWLASTAEEVTLGRLSDGANERVARPALEWSLEVLYRLAPAA